MSRTRKCSKCENIFPATLEHFYKERVNASGRVLLKGICKKCKKITYSCPKETRKAISRRYYARNKEKISEKARIRYAKKQGIAL